MHNIINFKEIKRKTPKKMKSMNKKEIEQKAEKIREKYNITGPIVDVLLLAQKMGFKVGAASLQSTEDGFILIDKDYNKIQGMFGIKTDKLIGVNASRTFQDKKFIIGHELGHFILHYPEKKVGKLYAHRENIKGKDEEENDADFFAACLLMPRDLFKKKYDELNAKKLDQEDIIILLTKHFDVTYESAKRRIKEIAS